MPPVLSPPPPPQPSPHHQECLLKVIDSFLTLLLSEMNLSLGQSYLELPLFIHFSKKGGFRTRMINFPLFLDEPFIPGCFLLGEATFHLFFPTVWLLICCTNCTHRELTGCSVMSVTLNERRRTRNLADSHSLRFRQM